jgi:hypothetical protein
MALSVIGSGFGRTGTRSLKDALELLGFGPCHHMEEVFGHPESVQYWRDLNAGKTVDWNQVFDGYKAQVDWPGSHVWRELSGAFPDAKVIHSHRPDDSWWNSYSRTIGKVVNNYKNMPMPPHITAMMDTSAELFIKPTFGCMSPDKEAALAAYHLRAELVRAAIPADRLLVFDVAEGWEPLCSFLGVAVPDVPFPHQNTVAEFWSVLGGEPV